MIHGFAAVFKLKTDPSSLDFAYRLDLISVIRLESSTVSLSCQFLILSSRAFVPLWEKSPNPKCASVPGGNLTGI